jgi:prepilin-type N-terminal cleavage/methylation domain-containing protein
MIAGASQSVSSRTLQPVRRCGGFTLIEVIISITLFSIALSLLLGGFRFASKAWDAGDRISSQTADLQVTHRVFSNLLGRAFPVTLEDGDDLRFAFDADSRHLRFTAFMPPYPDIAGLYTIEFFIVQEEGKDQLRLQRTLFDAATFPQKQQQGDDVLLLETPGRLTFSYFAQGEGADTESWQHSWGNIDQFPQMVRLSLEAVAEGTVNWPDIVSRIEINLDNACVFPEYGGKCRTL